MVEVADAPNYEAVLEDFMRLYAKDVALPEMVERLCSYVAWVRQGLCFIRSQSAEIISLVHNRIQHVQLGTAMFQAARGMPVRIVILKARKGGSSTLWQTLMVFFGAHYPNQIGLMLAHVPDSTREIFLIAKLAAKHYPAHCDPLDLSLRWPQSTGSRYYCHTAGGANVGAGGTPSMLHLSEVALWERNKVETLTSSLKSVPYELSTIVVLESTARGREEFFNLFDDARNDEDHPFVSIFVPWFLDERLTIASDRLELDDDERSLVNLARHEYGIELSDGQLAWRRNEIKATPGGLSIFRQEYPSTAEEAVQGRASLILPGVRQAVIDTLPFDPRIVSDDARIGGADFGYNDPTVIGTGFYVDQVLYVTDVGHYVNKLAREQVGSIVSGHRYFCDPSALQARKEIIAEMPRSVVAAMVPAPRMVDKRFTHSTNDAEWEALRKGFVDGKVKILRSCSRQIVLEADNFEWDEKTGKPKRSRNPGIWYHFDCLDMLRYMYVGCVLSAQQGGVVIVQGNY